MTSKISPTQQAVLDKLRQTGQPLVRWPGGFWSYKGCPPSHQGKLDHGGNYSVPSWHCSAQTMNALEDRKLIRRTNHFPEPWRDHRELVREPAAVDLVLQEPCNDYLHGAFGVCKRCGREGKHHG